MWAGTEELKRKLPGWWWPLNGNAHVTIHVLARSAATAHNTFTSARKTWHTMTSCVANVQPANEPKTHCNYYDMLSQSHEYTSAIILTKDETSMSVCVCVYHLNPDQLPRVPFGENDNRTRGACTKVLCSIEKLYINRWSERVHTFGARRWPSLVAAASSAMAATGSCMHTDMQVKSFEFVMQPASQQKSRRRQTSDTAVAAGIIHGNVRIYCSPAKARALAVAKARCIKHERAHGDVLTVY